MEIPFSPEAEHFRFFCVFLLCFFTFSMSLFLPFLCGGDAKLKQGLRRFRSEWECIFSFGSETKFFFKKNGDHRLIPNSQLFLVGFFFPYTRGVFLLKTSIRWSGIKVSIPRLIFLTTPNTLFKTTLDTLIHLTISLFITPALTVRSYSL